jgi:hypothetical protein
MNVLLGFDPGGAGAFGWCVAEHSPELPIRVLRTGIANHAEDAVAAARRELSPADSVIGAGIDAPLFWTAAGDRRSDQLIRTQILALGAQPGSVQHVSSLQGACLVQGMLAAMLLRDLYPALPLSESHSKAFLWLTGFATDASPPGTIALSHLPRLLTSDGRAVSDHERDAALATLSAWAMLTHPTDWTELHRLELHPYTPLAQPLEYWIPSSTNVA